MFCASLDLLTNRSLQEPIDSDKIDYVHSAIRDRNITGTSITIILCGAETWKRKCVDWEIGSTINKGHALLGICLPTAIRLPGNKAIVPDRLYQNWLSSYAAWAVCPVTAADLLGAIDEAVSRSKLFTSGNALPFMTRNRS